MLPMIIPVPFVIPAPRPIHQDPGPGPAPVPSIPGFFPQHDPRLAEDINRVVEAASQVILDSLTFPFRMGYRGLSQLHSTSSTFERNVASSRAITANDVVASMSATLAHTRAHDTSGNPFMFFSAYLVEDRVSGGMLQGIVPKAPLTIAGAVSHINSIPHGARTEGVIAFSHDDAFMLANALGGPTVWGPEIHGDGSLGFFWHYHPRYNPHAHIWFLWH